MKELKEKINKLKVRRDALAREIETCYCFEKLRELSLVQHKINVCRQRISGQWTQENSVVTQFNAKQYDFDS